MNIQTSIYHFEEGGIRYIEQMKGNHLHGEIIEYYQNGRIRVKEFYIDNKKYGTFYKWDESGKLIYKQSFKKGTLTK
jgi:antitoxin component YwqK of YwqJK toxin-antitoxin module